MPLCQLFLKCKTNALAIMMILWNISSRLMQHIYSKFCRILSIGEFSTFSQNSIVSDFFKISYLNNVVSHFYFRASGILRYIRSEISIHFHLSWKMILYDHSDNKTRTTECIVFFFPMKILQSLDNRFYQNQITLASIS